MVVARLSRERKIVVKMKRMVMICAQRGIVVQYADSLGDHMHRRGFNGCYVGSSIVQILVLCR